MPQNNDYYAGLGLAWAQALHRDLLRDEGPQALATLLTAGWSALANLARDSEQSAALELHLREAIARVREEITEHTQAIDSLLDLARQMLLSDWPAQPTDLAQAPPRRPPHLGPLQKEQASLDALQQALSEYQAAGLRYAQTLSELFEIALSEYQRELSADARAEPIARTARELHDLWLQIAEQTYERFLSREEHTQDIGGLVNAWVDLQLALRPVVDEMLRHMGLPSRRDMDDVQRHLDRLRRQQRTDITRLQREIMALRAELATWRGDLPSPPRKPRARKSNRS